MLKVNFTLGGLEYCEFLLGGENRVTGDDPGLNGDVYDGARDHLWMVYDYGKGAFFMIDDPGTYDGTYGANLGAYTYYTLVTVDGIVYGVNAVGLTEITEDNIPLLKCFQYYHQNIASDSEVIICGIKSI